MFQVSIIPQLENIRTTREALYNTLTNTNINHDILNNILLVFTEIVTNIIRHSEPSPHCIEINLQPKENNLWQFEVSDNGGNFNAFIDKIGDLPKKLEVNKLDDGKMGLFLLKKYFPNHRYFNDGFFNHLLIVFSAHGDSINRPKVLIIEDDVFTAKLLKKSLCQTHNITLAYTAAEGLHALQEMQFDLVLCDIGLPDKSGLEIRKEINSLEEQQTVPFIFLTANDDIEIEQKANDLGVDDYLKKPIEPFDLYQIIERTLNRAKQVKGKITARLDHQVTTRLHPHLPCSIGALHTVLFAKEAEAGGGDMVVHFPRENSDIIILADITGHGVEAKYFVHLYTGYLYGMLRSLRDNFSVAELMKNLNELIYDDPNIEGFYLTCLIMEVKDHTIEICNGGHLQPLLIRDSSVTKVNITGAMPGITTNNCYESVVIDLQEGDQLFCTTDGLIEGNGSPQESDIFSAELMQTLSTEKGQKALFNDIQHLYEQHFGSEKQKDDITYFIMGRD